MFQSRKDAGLSQEFVASKVGISQGTLSEAEWTANGSSHTAEFAALYKVDAHWLATGHGRKRQYPRLVGEKPLAVEEAQPLSYPKSDDVFIPKFDTGGRMGNGGLVLKDQPGVINGWRVSTEWVTKNVRHATAPQNLAIVTGFGDSMEPLFSAGDPVLIDMGVREFSGDAIYFFRVDGEGFIKRLQSIPGEGLRVISANREGYDAWTLREGMDFEVFGRVLKVWKGRDF